MSSVVYTIEPIEEFRSKARRVRKTFKSTGKRCWHRSDFDPEQLVDVYPALSVRQGHCLIAYIHHDEMGNSRGDVAGFVEGSNAHREALKVPVGVPICWPAFGEPGVLPAMAAIDGDGSAMAYLSASLLHRELLETGAYWHGITWDVERVIAPRLAKTVTRESEDEDPPMEDLLARLQWPNSTPSVASLAPRVLFDAGAIQVVFHTYSRMGCHHATRWTDVYEGNYDAEWEKTILAEGESGFNF